MAATNIESVPSASDDTEGEALRLAVAEERLDVSKRRVVAGTVRISTTTETVEEVAEVEVDRYRVEITRVPVGRAVDAAPLARAEGDVTVIPVLEERMVVVKQLFLKEELHIRHVVEREVVRTTVPLRRQRVAVERSTARIDPVDADEA